MSYREFADTDPAIACTWTQDVTDEVEQLIVPDGCVDLVWLAGRELVVAGPDTGAHRVALPAGSRTVGVRVRPGAAGTLLGLPARTVRDRQLLAVDVQPEWSRLSDALAAAPSPTAARALLAATVRLRGTRRDPLVARAAALLARRRQRVSTVADEIGISERHLLRRCEHAVGYGPKTLARVARLQLLTRTTGPLAERALAAGYAGQAHMSDDVRALTGLTAVRFLEDRGATVA